VERHFYVAITPARRRSTGLEHPVTVETEAQPERTCCCSGCFEGLREIAAASDGAAFISFGWWENVLNARAVLAVFARKKTARMVRSRSFGRLRRWSCSRPCRASCGRIRIEELSVDQHAASLVRRLLRVEDFVPRNGRLQKEQYSRKKKTPPKTFTSRSGDFSRYAVPSHLPRGQQ
jgi:hypothetical protein